MAEQETRLIEEQIAPSPLAVKDIQLNLNESPSPDSGTNIDEPKHEQGKEEETKVPTTAGDEPQTETKVPITSPKSGATLQESQQPPAIQAPAPWRSYNGPKLFVKPKMRNSNQQIIQKAIAKALEGTANAQTLKKIKETIDANQATSGQFLILFRNNQFKGLYDYQSKLETIIKLDGIGPKIVNLENIVRFFKYDLSKRQFIEVETKHIGPTIIAFTLSNLKPKQ